MDLAEAWRGLALIPRELVGEDLGRYRLPSTVASQKVNRFVTTELPEAWSLVTPSLKTVILPDGLLEKLRQSASWVALAPGSVWATKRWVERGWTELADKIIESGANVVWVGAANERALCEKLCGGRPKHIVVAGELSLAETASLMSRMSAVVANDSGAMHLASAVGTPVVGIFGPTVPSQGYVPWSDRARIAQIDLACRPCGAHGHQKCPIDTHACMENLSAKTVFGLLTDVTKS